MVQPNLNARARPQRRKWPWGLGVGVLGEAIQIGGASNFKIARVLFVVAICLFFWQIIPDLIRLSGLKRMLSFVGALAIAVLLIGTSWIYLAPLPDPEKTDLAKTIIDGVKSIVEQQQKKIAVVPDHVSTPTAPRLPSPPPQPRALKLIFKESSSLTPKRKDRITEEMEAFYRYLVAVGFTPPTVVPPIGVNASGGSIGVYPASTIYDQDLFISEQGVDNPQLVRAVYGDYTFSTLLDLYPPDPQVSFNRTWTAHILSGYFNYSFSNTKPTGNPKSLNGWNFALWDIRSVCGRDFTDRALFYSVGAPEPSSGPYDPQMQGFNKYFRDRFARGEAVVDDAVLSGLACTNKILNARGLGGQ